MPELPEVETILRGISPAFTNQKIVDVIIRAQRLRWPIPKNLKQKLLDQVVTNISRRGRYLLLETRAGTVIIHLGMSGKLQVLPKDHLLTKHEHLNIVFENSRALCYIDPRRFGAILWTEGNPLQYPLLANLGLEPFDPNFNGEYLLTQARNRKICIKQFIMNNSVVTGVGNIYANEALFRSKIYPFVPAKAISKKQFQTLAINIQKILKQAIENSGTTLRDYATSEGKSGAFQKLLQVYGRNGKPCQRCKTILQQQRIGQRSTVFCPRCQTPIV